MVVDENDYEAKQALKKLNKIRFFICEKDRGFYAKKVNDYLPENTYHDLMVVKDGSETVVFKMKEIEKNEIKEIVLIVTKPNSFVAISFSGHFTMEDAKEVASSVNRDKIGDINM